MAFDPSSLFTGWSHRVGRTLAYIGVTTKGGDASPGGSSSDAQGVGWAPVMALTSGAADEVAPLGSATNPLVTKPGSGASGGAPYVGTPLGYQQIVGLVASTALTVPNGATYAVISVEGMGVRWRDDGTAPTAAVGMPMGVGQQMLYSSGLANLKFIQQAATATLDISYYK